MNMEDYTSPRPWSVNGHTIEADDENLWLHNMKTGKGVVATLPSAPKSRFSKADREEWDKTPEANAKLIVDLVNGHDAVNEALKKLLTAIEGLGESVIGALDANGAYSEAVAAVK